MAHLTLKLHNRTVKIEKELAVKSLEYGFCADNVLKWVYIGVMNDRKRKGLSVGKRCEKKMRAMAIDIVKNGSREIFDCR